MNLFKRNLHSLANPNRPQDPFALMNEMMANFWSDNRLVKDYSPSVEVKETKTDYSVTAELAGLSKEDVEIEFENNSLCLKGEKKYERENNTDEKIHYTERYYGSFTRIIPFVEEVDVQKIDAQFKDGLLSICLPKKPVDKVATGKIAIK